MRVLMLSQFYPPILGGEELSVQNLSTQLALRGHHVAVATMTQPDQPAFEVQDGVRVHRIHGSVQRAGWLFSEARRPHAPPVPDPELMLALHRLVREERPDVVHAHNWLGYQYLPLKQLAPATSPPLVLTLHDMSLVCATKAFMYGGESCSGPGFPKCLRCAADHYGPAKGSVTLAASTAMNALQRRGVDMFLPVSWSCAASNQLVGSGLPFQVIPNFLPDDLGAAEPGYEDYLAQLPQGDFLLFVGGLRRLKGIEVLLRAYSSLRDAPPLVLIGYDCLDTPTSWPDSVIVLKNWPRGAVMQAWRRCLMGLVPSIVQESFGLVALEAMACGKPVIASRIGGLQEVVVDGQSGLLIEPGSTEALRGALERLLGSAELRAQMGAAARQRADEFRAHTVVPQIERLYQELTSRPRQARRRAAAGARVPTSEPTPTR